MSGLHLFDATNSIDHELQIGKTTIGRHAECGIRLLSSSVSRKHGLLEYDGEKLVYSDLGSSNGSFLNGVAISAAVPLGAGDTLMLGDFSFTVNKAGQAGDAMPVDDEATQVVSASGAAEKQDIPSVWSEGTGLESASNTQFFVQDKASDALADYRAGKIAVPPLGESPRLVGISGNVRALVLELTGDAMSWKIGRDAQSVDLVIPEESVSAQHAQVVSDGARWKIVNWMSKNGTFVNNQKGLSTYLGHGDVIRLGNAELVFELPARGGRRAAGRSGIGGFFGRLFGR